ncbi:hypothetical protein KY290_013707 [Solanum tuberosum]|uniref:DUF4216 domain-containing protein n=1 Tax=Solanum tuberosum TaxID=4113 RepID=A0ABQ7VNR7_SOLTU|nr:hypothetical protein KY290_013707 [Solanum tuberosum]
MSGDEGKKKCDLPGGTQPGLGDNPYRQMVLDAARSNFGQGSSSQCYRNIEPESSYHYESSIEEVPNLSMEDEPNPDSQRFYDLLQSADRELYPGSSLSQLALVSRMLNIKMENTLSQRGCMLYWDDDKDLTSCKLCGYERYKRQVGSPADMRWHHEHIQEEGVIRHPSNSEAWKHFSETHSFSLMNQGMKDRKNFLKGHTVTRSPPPVRTGQEILNQICELGIRNVTELDAEEVNKRLCNKASVEGSICEAYLMAESTQFFSHYFEPHVMSRHHNVSSNDDGGVMKDDEENLSIFTHPGRLSGEAKKRDLSLEEIKAAQTYILLNCQEVEPFVSMYVQRLQEEFPNLSQDQIDESLETYFSLWFKEYVRSNHIENEYLRSLAHGPLISVYSYPVCFVNGYKFHTVHRGSARSTMNSRVFISDPNTGDYYGRIQEIIQVEYRKAPLKQVMLFKCEWFDPVLNIGVKVHNQYKLVDVNHRRRFKKYEPFILAMQATQVCYMSYPSTKKDKDDWLAVLKVNPRDVIELPDEGVITIPEPNLPFQVEEVEVHEIDMNIIVDETILLHDPNGEAIEMDEPIDYGLFLEHHELDEEFTEDEYETENESEEDDEEFEEEIDTD